MNTFRNVAIATTLGLSGLVLQGCAGSPEEQGLLNLPDINLPIDLPIDLPDLSVITNTLTEVLSSISTQLNAAESINLDGLDGTLATLTDAINHAQASLADAITAAQDGNQADVNEAISDVITTLVNQDLVSTADSLAGQFGTQFPGSTNPFTSVSATLTGLLSALVDSNGDIKPANLESAVAIVQTSVESLLGAVELLEILTIAEQNGLAIDELSNLTNALIDVPDLVGLDIPVGNALSAALTPALTDLSSALLAADPNDISGSLVTIGSAASTLVSATGLGLQGLDSNLTDASNALALLDPLGTLGLDQLLPSADSFGLPGGLDLGVNPLTSAGTQLNASLAALGVSDTPTNRQDVILAIESVVVELNRALLSLTPPTLNPRYDPLVGLIITVTNLLDNTAGDGQDTTIAEALVGNLSGDATAASIGTAYAQLIDDVFTRVFPVSEASADADQALRDSAAGVGNLATGGIAAILTPVTSVIGPMVTCLEAFVANEATADLLGLDSNTSCFSPASS